MLLPSLVLFVKEPTFQPFLHTSCLCLRYLPMELLSILFSLESYFMSLSLLKKLRSVSIIFELNHLEGSSFGLCNYTDETMD